MTLLKPYPRLWSLEAGIAMVVTDLHGDWDAYRRYRDRFVTLHARGQAHTLIFTGDLIHRQDGNPEDGAIEIVLDVLALQATYGPAIIYLCGNHELPHIYSISLARGEASYTPPFEEAVSRSGQRPAVTALFNSLPFYLRTRAGVAITHAGAAAPLAQSENAARLFNWNHEEILTWAEEIMAGEDIEALRRGYAKLHHMLYPALARHYLAVDSPQEPRYNHLLRGALAANHPWFDRILWPALFNRAEQEYGLADYAIFLNALLQELSVNYAPQELLISGHIPVKGGHHLVAKRNIRLAGAAHAGPREAGQYLLFDAAAPVNQAGRLLAGLGSVF